MTISRRPALSFLARFAGVCALALCLAAPAFPAAAAPSDARFQAFVQQLRPAALAAGVSGATFDRAFRGLGPDGETIELSQKQPEFRTTIAQYIDTRVSDTRIANGQLNYQQWGDTLAAIEKLYGVDRYVVLSVWGMETNYGAFMGGHNVIQTLATLACCQSRRPDYFRKELISALQILEQGHVSPENMVGSWAGAMGHTQFMPTSFKAYAADGTRDGKRDIWTSIPDALASTANYLKKNGWRAGETWGYEVLLPDGFAARKGARMSLAQWQATGVRRAAGGGFARGSDQATLLLPGGRNGPAFLMLQNFRVIKRYNNADSYALGVGHLADRIRGGGPFVTPWPNHDKPLNEPERLELQALLARRGFDIGEADGKIGPATRTAIMSYQQAKGLEADGYAGVSLLRHLRTGR